MEPTTALRNTAPPRRERIFFGYVAAVCLAALGVVAPHLGGLPHFLTVAPAGFWVMAGLAVVADIRPFTPMGRRQVSPVYPSICFTFATLLMWGLGPAVLVQTAAVAAWSLPSRHRSWRAAFNAAQYALSFAAAAGIMALADDAPVGLAGRVDWDEPVLALVAAGVWFVVNYTLVAVAVWLRFGGGWWSLLRRTGPSEALATGALLLLAPVLVGGAWLSPFIIPFVLVPLYAVNRMARLSAQQGRLARLDPLTGLANRKALETEVADQVALRAGAPGDEPGREIDTFALLLLDLDRFKHVNDALGHSVGDQVLVQVADRIRRAVRPGDLVARLGGDEFAIVAAGRANLAEARLAADRIADALATPVEMDGLPLDVGGAIGIAVYPDHGEDFATLMRHADVAMYDAKSRGDPVAVYARESDHNSPERLSLLADLRRALEAPGCDEIAFYYQPQVELSTGVVIGVEALLRWHHPVRGLVDPEELIRVAEHSAVMRPLTMRVVDDVVAQLAKWEVNGLSLRAAINVSVRDLHTGEIVERLADRLARHGVDADRIQLEITEGALMADPRRVLATLRRLDRLGIALSLDDFGTGYSSMQHLRRLPLAEVKIDRSFVMGMAEDPDDEAIVRSIIELANALGLRVVAEGVENEGTFRRLVAAGCHVAQGWFYARPMPAEELALWLARYRPPQQLLL